MSLTTLGISSGPITPAAPAFGHVLPAQLPNPTPMCSGPSCGKRVSGYLVTSFGDKFFCTTACMPQDLRERFDAERQASADFRDRQQHEAFVTKRNERIAGLKRCLTSLKDADYRARLEAELVNIPEHEYRLQDELSQLAPGSPELGNFRPNHRDRVGIN